MIIDLDEAGSGSPAGQYNVCIAGGGVAGIVLATSMADKGLRVLLLEAGGLFPTNRSQDVYRGDIVGHEYFDLDTARLRYLGGTSGHWAGWCRPLDAHDFERRDYVPESGWPIGIADIEPYLTPAREVLELNEFPPNTTLPGSDGLLTEARFSFSGQGDTVRFLEKYESVLAASDKIDVVLNANVVDIIQDADTSRVTRLAYRGYQDEAKVRAATAAFFVLAMGGIENARALLNAKGQQSTGLGNQHGLVGRYFMEHPTFNVGYYILERGRRDFGRERRFISPSPELMQREQIGNSSARMEGVGQEPSLQARAKEELRSLLCASDQVSGIVRRFRHSFNCGTTRAMGPQDLPGEAGAINMATEQMPNSESRVMLSEETDRFGLRRAALDWRLTLREKLNMRNSTLAIGAYFATEGIGRIRIFDWVLEDDPNFPSLGDGDEVAGFHHMGTTRMGVDARDGVVDRNCRLFGVDNFYIAGSSVFRTSGYANPTLTIVQLALRLSDHLVERSAQAS